MKKLIGEEEVKAKAWMLAALKEAQQASCNRAHCGSVIVKHNQIIGSGFNSPPANLESQARCNKKNELSPTFKSDRTCCQHAEVRAILDALRNFSNLIVGSNLYFVRADMNTNKMLYSGKPYCTICSKMSLDVGIKEFVLWHEDGITAYDTAEYNDLSFQS